MKIKRTVSSEKAAADAVSKVIPNSRSEFRSALWAVLPQSPIEFEKLPSGAWAAHLSDLGLVVERATKSQIENKSHYTYTVHTPESYASGVEGGHLAAMYQLGQCIKFVRSHHEKAPVKKAKAKAKG